MPVPVEDREQLVADSRARRRRDLVGLGDDPLTRLRLHGWLGFAEHTSLEWLAHREVDRQRLLQLWMEQFVALSF